MNKTVRNIGLAALAAGVLYYPAMRLYRAMAARRKQDDMGENTDHVMKNFVPAYRGLAKHNHTHRKTRK
jgi:hypothetical protein